MKIRNPLLIQASGFAGAWAVRWWMSTLRYQYRPLGPNVDPNQPGFEGRYIYAFWHENMLLPAFCYARPDIHVLISQHADGQMIAEVCRHLGFRVVRGSTTREGAKAVRQMLRLSQRSHLAITPDGPRGPRRKVQQGLVYMASKTGMPVVPTGVGFKRPWRARSWDRFALPRPWSLGTCVTGDPISVPANLTKTEFEDYRRRIEEALLAVTEAAERYAAAG